MSVIYLRLIAFTTFGSLLATLASGGCELQASGTGESQALEPADQQEPGSIVAPSTGLVPRVDDAGGPVAPAVTADGGAPPLRADAAVPASEPDASAPPEQPGGRRCGTRGGIACGPQAFCDFEPDPSCGATDRGGHCAPRPSACTTVYAPVCGCDGRSYPNACEAHAAGISVMQEGLCPKEACERAGGRVVVGRDGRAPACPHAVAEWSVAGGVPSTCCVGEPPATTCGGIAGLACGAGEFCDYERSAVSSGCGVADATGVCRPQPEVCTREYAPVCGCDRRTYATRCVAHAAGVSVLREGACTERDCRSIGGRPVDGIGPPPACAAGERNHGTIRYEGGAIAIEGTICCVPRGR